MRTRGEKSNEQSKPQPAKQPAGEWDRDLQGDTAAKENIGMHQGTELPDRTAADVKALHRCLRNFTADELAEIPILRENQPLQQGATYFDIAQPSRGEFTVEGPLRTQAGALYVPKARVHHAVWNRLLEETQGRG